MKKVAGLLKRRFENIITYLTHPITNATSESINAKIQWVKYTARGFRDKTELHQRDLFPLWRSGPGSWDPLRTRLGEKTSLLQL
jgi:hypothetical protein